MSKLEEESYFRKEKENALKAVAYSKQYRKDNNKNYLIWKNADCVNFISQCLFAGEKEMRNKSKDIESSINCFPLLIMIKLQQLPIH
jgi:hypothetical protein